MERNADKGLERKITKIATALKYAEECSRATVFHLRYYEHLYRKDADDKAVNDVCREILAWCDQFDGIKKEIGKVKEAVHTSTSGDSSAIPIIYYKTLPNRFKMSEVLFRVNYYPLENNPLGSQEKHFTEAEVFENVQELDDFSAQCMKALVAVDYKGVCEQLGLLLQQQFASKPTEITYRLSLDQRKMN